RGFCVHVMEAQTPKPRLALHFAHANGFHGPTYAPLLEAIDPSIEVHAMDLRGYGASTADADPKALRSWKTYADDLCDYLETIETPLVLAGHSMGGTISMQAAARLGGRVRGLFLVEPVVIPKRLRVAVELIRAAGLTPPMPLADGALRRKSHFESKEAALERYRGRGAFKT